MTTHEARQRARADGRGRGRDRPRGQRRGRHRRTVQAQGEMFRQYQGFGAIVPVPDGATTFDRALSLSGRDPRWKP